MSSLSASQNSSKTMVSDGRRRQTVDEDDDQQVVVTTILPTDILLGRGAGMAQHTGNVRFRALVHRHKHEYTHAGSTRAKQAIARQILQEIITQHDGRFLRKMAHSLDDEELDEQDKDVAVEYVESWVLADEAVALEKIKQCLRDKERWPKSEQQNEPLQDRRSSSSTLPLADASPRAAVESSTLAVAAVNASTRSASLVPTTSAIWHLQCIMAQNEQARQALRHQHQRERDVLKLQQLCALQQHLVAAHPSECALPSQLWLPNDATILQNRNVAIAATASGGLPNDMMLDRAIPAFLVEPRAASTLYTRMAPYEDYGKTLGPTRQSGATHAVISPAQLSALQSMLVSMNGGDRESGTTISPKRQRTDGSGSYAGRY